MKQISVKEARKLLSDAKRNQGQFFGVHFSPRNSETDKVINGKSGMRTGLAGVGKRYSDKLHGLVTVWARNRGGYRSIPLEGIHTINYNGETYRVVPEKETLLVGWGIKPLFE